MLRWVELGRRFWDVEAAVEAVESSSWLFVCAPCRLFHAFSIEKEILVNIYLYFISKTTNKLL
jgi:hypothetical protein